MYIKDYISKDYPVFTIKDSIENASDVAKEFGYSHIFITKKNILIGALSQAFLEDSPEGSLESLEMHFEKFAILEDGNILDSVKLFYVFNSNVVPVISNIEKYMGYISFDDVFSEFSKYPLFSENGAILTIETSGIHYSLSEITRLIESSNAKIYGCYVSAILANSIQITLKISYENLASVDETLERYGYTIVNKHYQDEKDELMKDRYGFLTKYLEV